MSDDRGVVTPVAAVVVMAAGAGTRMKSATPKVLHKVAGKSMISLAVDAADALTPDRLVVVVGHGREQVSNHLAEIAPHVVVAVQEQQLGTGDAVRAVWRPWVRWTAKWWSPPATCRCWPVRL